jgi:hypothetical protein
MLLRALIFWIVFTVSMSLLPIAGSALPALAQGHSVDVLDLVGKGEALLVAVAILAAALGEVLRGESPTRGLYRAGLVSAAFFVIVIGILAYAVIFTLVSVGVQQAHVFTADLSAAIFSASVATGICCVAVAESKS